MRRSVPAVLAILLIGSSACTPDHDEAPTRAPDDPVRVASFNFPESVLLGEIFAQTLEAEGVPVERVLDLGPREVVQPALQLGVVDVVPEYLGSALDFARAEAGAAGFDVDDNLLRLDLLFGRRDLRVLDPAPAENTNVVAVTAERAMELGVRTISDLEPVASELSFAGPPECPERELCLLGFEEVYGLDFAEFVPQASTAIRAEQLRRGEVDVALLFSTDSVLAGSELFLLEDDRDVQPAENIIAVVREPVVDQYGNDVVEALERVTAQLTTRTLAELNQLVEADGEAVEVVATRWLEEVRVSS